MVFGRGDRDGNPFVTTEITRKVAAKLQDSILKCYARDLRALRRRLTFRGVDKLVSEIERKIYNWSYGAQRGYKAVEDLVADLNLVRKRLVEDHDGLFLDLLDTFLIKVKLFGFHFASLDVRQDSRRHDFVWNHILDCGSKSGKTISGADF